MATYNRAHFIAETLRSIQNQTYKNWECLIVDDGGADNTLEVIASFFKEDNRFQYFKRPSNYNKGLPGCRNFGLDIAKGDFIVFFDDDDIIHPQNLEICSLALLSNKHVSFCHYFKKPFTEQFDYSDIHNIVDYKLTPTPKNILEKMITGEFALASCTVLWRNDCFKNVRFNETLMYAEEWECYQRILSNQIGVQGTSIERFLYFNRKHQKSNTGEFWEHNPLRVQSKKKAIKLIVENLYTKHLFSRKLLTYLAGLAISYRDVNLLNEILNISNTTLKNGLYLKFKFYMFPLWRRYKKR